MVCYDVALNADVMAIAQNALVGVVPHNVALYDNVVRVVELDSIPAVCNFKTFDTQPTNRAAPTFLGLKLNPAATLAIQDRLFIIGVLEHDRFSRLAGKPWPQTTAV